MKGTLVISNRAKNSWIGSLYIGIKISNKINPKWGDPQYIILGMPIGTLNVWQFMGEKTNSC